MRTLTLRYRCPAVDGPPLPGFILMGRRARRAYRVLQAAKARGTPAIGCATWSLKVESISAESARVEIALGAAHWEIVWDRRK